MDEEWEKVFDHLVAAYQISPFAWSTDNKVLENFSRKRFANMGLYLYAFHKPSYLSCLLQIFGFCIQMT